jgi:hypothetical protein
LASRGLAGGEEQVVRSETELVDPRDDGVDEVLGDREGAGFVVLGVGLED